ncbi:MAG: DUF2892 domain-containing protein [Kiritimatiellia bacterium]|nr:DUF2892 domain-containing protein [Kiritimatiellia bacterium]
MTVENGVRVVAGAMILISVALTRWVHPQWIWFTVFIGANLIQSAFTGICPAVKILRALGLKDGSGCGC